MTLGNLKLRMLKQFPGLDLDVLEGFISDRYSEILQELPWSRQNAMAVLQTTAPYATGTAGVTADSSSITGTGTAWSSAMTGRAFRVSARDEYYEFTYISPTSASLDRVYEGATDAAAGYKIFQNIYPLPADLRLLQDDAFSTTQWGPMERTERYNLNVSYPTRPSYGTPTVWAPYMDDGSTPPRMQIELYPIPDDAYGIPFDYLAQASVPSTTSASFLPWMEPTTALVEGVVSKILRHLKDYAGAQLAAAEAKDALLTMRQNEALRTGPTRMELSDHYTRHRSKRWGC